MQFTLVYHGPLKSNGGAKEKHAIREEINRQLTKLWDYPPLNGYVDFNEGQLMEHFRFKPSPVVLNEIRGLKIAPVFRKAMHAAVELDILLLRSEPPGSFVVSGGDIDNRLKTLFDALRAPHNEGELPKYVGVPGTERQFLTLLEDDCQIIRVNVETDILLEPCDQSVVQLFIRVKTRLIKVTPYNIGLA
jgi:hypothetical protein